MWQYTGKSPTIFGVHYSVLISFIIFGVHWSFFTLKLSIFSTILLIVLNYLGVKVHQFIPKLLFKFKGKKLYARNPEYMKRFH